MFQKLSNIYELNVNLSLITTFYIMEITLNLITNWTDLHGEDFQVLVYDSELV